VNVDGYGIETLEEWKRMASEQFAKDRTSRRIATKFVSCLSSLSVEALAPTAYNASKKLADSKKIEANLLFRDVLAVECKKFSDGDVLYLDAETAFTTTILAPLFQEGGVCEDLRLVPVNSDKQIACELINRGPGNLLVYAGLVNTYIKTAPKHSVAAAWLDYCVTFRGCENSTWSPESDLTLALEKQVVKHGGLLAFTVCTRVRGIPYAQIPVWFINKAVECGYRGTENLTPDGVVTTGMRMWIFKLNY
jgi:hypothetical protein